MTDEEDDSLADWVAELSAAVRRGDFIAHAAKCSPCQFGYCPRQFHTWMDVSDIEHDSAVIMPETPQQWHALAVRRPCGCSCMED